MPGKNKTPLLGWHPPAGLSAWVRDEAERRGVPLSSVLNEAVERLRSDSQPRSGDPGGGEGEQDERDRQARQHEGGPT